MLHTDKYNRNRPEGSFRERLLSAVSGGILRARYVIFLCFLPVLVYCILSLGKVTVNSDLTAFLPESTETRRGVAVMESEFVTYGSADVMVCGISLSEAETLSEELSELPHVYSVEFDDSTGHFKDGSALFTISFDGAEDDEEVIAAMDSVREKLRRFSESYVDTEIGVDYSSEIASEMGGVLLIAALVIIGVLLITSRSYFEVLIYFIVFIVAAVLNMGTNRWFGTISSITNSTAVILQLALAIDYAIILSHRYQDELALTPGQEYEAAARALRKGIPELISSGFTTVSGLIALTFMQFRLGRDLGLVLAKGIVCSLLTVILLMPGLLLLFSKPLRLTRHKKLVPSVSGWGRFLTRSRGIFALCFLVLIPGAWYLSENAPFAFHNDSVTELVESESRTAARKISETFTENTVVAVLLPSGDYEAEKTLLSDFAEMPEVVEAAGLAGILLKDGVYLTDAVDPEGFAELLGVLSEQAETLYKAYALEHLQLGVLFGKSEEVPLVDMFLYLFDKVESGTVTLEDGQQEMLEKYEVALLRGTAQLKGENWDRLVLNVDLPTEGEESVRFVENVRAAAEKLYGEGTVLVVGNITVARDLSDSFKSDSLTITLLTACFVFLILLATFRSVFGSLLLVFVIQGSIWLNFACSNLSGLKPSFVTYMIVSAIQMGATIDYAIVIMNRYVSLRTEAGEESREERRRNSREAVIRAVNDSFPTVMTSGIIMAAAGFLIAFRVSDVYIGHIGLGVGRGAVISMLLVLSVLPQLLLAGDGLIRKTTFGKKRK